MAQPKFPVRSLLTQIVTWIGRLGVPNTGASIVSSSRPLPRQTSTCRSTTTGNSTDLWNMFITSPYIFAGVRFRDVSRLWTGADNQKDEQDNITAPAQVVSSNPNIQESEQLTFCRWQLDHRLRRDMKQVLEQASYPKQIFGKSVMEILWRKETDGEYAGKIVIDDFVDVDPTLFVFNPKHYPPGLYLRKPTGTGSTSYEYTKVDERRFLVITNHYLFDDRNGISELESLRQTEPRREVNEKDWGRANQRSGRGTMIGSYGPELLGEEAEQDREDFQAALEQFDANNNTVMIKYEANTVEVFESTIQSTSFKDYSDYEIQQISLVLTGSPTTLKEGQFGNRSMAESTEVRRESNLEQADCADISAAFTEQVLRRACDFNWLKTESYPKMQIISPNLIAPTTPQMQDTNQEIMGEEAIEDEEEPEEIEDTEDVEETEKVIKESKIVKFQEEEEPDIPDYVPPEAVPQNYEDFPSTDPLPEGYQDIIETAQEYLQQMPVEGFRDLQPSEAATTFTIKRLRGVPNITELLTDLKTAIIPTLAADTEEQAWREYWAAAIPIFQKYGVPRPNIAIRDNLVISFRQARQNALNEGYLQSVLSDESVVGVRIVNTEGVKHHESHIFWNNIAIPKDSVELQIGGRLRNPMDFGCVCYYQKVYNLAELTPESEWPQVWPGDTYKYYANPGPGQTAAG